MSEQTHALIYLIDSTAEVTFNVYFSGGGTIRINGEACTSKSTTISYEKSDYMGLVDQRRFFYDVTSTIHQGEETIVHQTQYEVLLFTVRRLYVDMYPPNPTKPYEFEVLTYEANPTFQITKIGEEIKDVVSNRIADYNWLEDVGVELESKDGNILTIPSGWNRSDDSGSIKYKLYASTDAPLEGITIDERYKLKAVKGNCKVEIDNWRGATIPFAFVKACYNATFMGREGEIGLTEYPFPQLHG